MNSGNSVTNKHAMEKKTNIKPLKNHIKLSRLNFALGIMSLTLFIIIFMLFKKTDIAVLCLPSAFFYFALAIATRHELELARKICVGLGVLMIFGFPVGTIVAMYFYLPYTVWDKSNSESAQA